MLSEAYHQMYGKGEVVEEGRLGAGVGSLAGGALGATALPIVGAPIGAALGAALGAGSDDEGTHDKTGGKSDHDLLDAVEKKHTAGRALLDKARSELDHDGSLSAHTRDSLARDEYGYGGEDAEAAVDYPTFNKSEKKKSGAYNPWDDLPEGWDDEDAEDTDEADAGPEAERRKDEDEKAAKQGFRGKPATPAH